MRLGDVAAPEIELLLGEHDDGSAFRRLVSEGSQLCGIGQALWRHSRRGDERARHAVAQRDGAGLVEQQHVHVAGGLDRASAHRQDVALKHAVHAGDADGAQQAANSGGNQADQQRDQHGDREHHARVDAEGLQRHADEQEDHRERRQQNSEGDLVRRLLPLRAFHQRDHAIQEAVALFHRDADDDAVAKDARAAGDRAAVASAFTDDGRGFAGDGGLIDAGNAFHDIAVSRNDVAGLAHDEVALLKSGAGTFSSCPFEQAAGDRVFARFAQTLGLGFAAALSHGFGEVGEEHGEPEPDGQLGNEATLGGGTVTDADGGQRGADHGHEHDRVLDHQPRVEFAERVADSGTNDVPVKE